MLRGRRYNRTKKAANDGGKGTPKATDGQNVQQSTATTLATLYGVSEKTIRRDGKLAAEVAKDPELQEAAILRTHCHRHAI